MKTIFAATTAIFGVAFLLVSTPRPASSQSDAPAKPAVIITAADQKTVAQAQKNPRYDAVLTVVDGGKYNVSVALTHHETPLPNASAEFGITVVYIVTSGSGVLTTGGTIPEAKPTNRVGLPVGPGIAGPPNIQGGVSRKMGVGDFAVIPPNTPHSWTEVDPPLNVMAVRVDSEHALPAGYLNPALKQ
jgi:hypothetical protein